MKRHDPSALAITASFGKITHPMPAAHWRALMARQLPGRSAPARPHASVPAASLPRPSRRPARAAAAAPEPPMVPPRRLAVSVQLLLIESILLIMARRRMMKGTIPRLSIAQLLLGQAFIFLPAAITTLVK
jgi:hypothetical protein